MKRLGVNIDHVATLRNARGEYHPDPIYAAKFVKKLGADSITIHLREDRRHINDLDAKKICGLKNVLVNLEISMNKEIVNKALKIKPNFICLVPEKFKELKSLVYEYKKIKDKEILNLTEYHSNLKNEIEAHKINYENLVEKATSEIETFIKKHETDTQVQ